TADLSGLYFYTTATNQVLETNSTVDISYHYAGAAYLNLFDTDGDGLPDWWEILYGLDPNNADTGNTGIPDGYKQDSAGDGWDNLQKYQMGIAPNVFTTPPAPQGVTLQVNPTNGAVTLSWQPSSGSVTGYTVARYDNGTFTQTNIYVGLTNKFVDLNSPAFTDIFDTPTEYAVFADYSQGDSPTGQYLSQDSVNPADTPYAKSIAGPGGSNALVFAHIPAGITNLILYRVDSDYGGNVTAVTNFTVAVASIVSNIFWIPTNWVPTAPPVSQWDIEAVGLNGKPSQTDGAGIEWPLFYDGRAALQQNVSFMLRAGRTNSFDYTLDGTHVVPPTGYIYASFDDAGNDFYDYYWYPNLVLSRPFDENYRFRNFAFGTNDLDSEAYLNTGFERILTPSEVGLVSPLKYLFQLPTNTTQVACLMDTNQSRWMFPYTIGNVVGADNLPDIDIQTTTTNTYLIPSNFTNHYGLPLVSVMMVYPTTTGPQFQQIAAGGVSSGPPGNATGYAVFYPEFAQPVMQTVGYYFGYDFQIDGNETYHTPIPGDAAFSPTNAQPVLLAAVGQPVQVVAFAKQTASNCNSNALVYVQQYFDKAYKADANGNITTNQTGILSPYGLFFPTEPGKVFLTTLPDGATGATGQCVVNVIKLAVDVNHDGVMDLTATGPDNTISDLPFKFWVNDNYDRSFYDSDDQTNYEDDVAPQLFTDCNYTNSFGNPQITTKRDLEDYARLWVVNVSNVLSQLPSGSSVQLGIVYGPTINLFQAAETNGGTLYLTDTPTATNQIDPFFSPFVGAVVPGQNIQLNACIFGGGCWRGDHFIFCGAAPGSGELYLQILDPNANVLVYSSVFIQMNEIKQMYERWTVGDIPGMAPTNAATPAVEDLPGGTTAFQYSYNALTDTNTPYILFTHGWNMSRYDKDRFAETAFKRLYWQGYQGRFGAFRWPTENGFQGISSVANKPSEKDNFDRSENAAWKSAAGLLNKLGDLNAKYPGRVYLLAHSMGNVVAGEALRLSGNSQVVNTYVASQGAVSAHTYDTNVANYSFTYSGVNFGPNTPNIYGNWFSGNFGGGAGSVVNFYNTNDFALARGRWQLGELFKPDRNVLEGQTTWSYGYSGSATDAPPWNAFFKASSGGTVGFFVNTSLNDRYEVMSFAAQAYTTALGATPSVAHVAASVNLNTVWLGDPTGNGYAEHFWHSAEFRGDNSQQGNYWNELLGSSAFNLK
ncbi:MAG TPA: alpha/beta hydrolase, partial [Cyclobacteriaceae bacterium]|nr:alpha/beta hydrolase [Cyclobacteriaceae bacterium]